MCAHHDINCRNTLEWPITSSYPSMCIYTLEWRSQSILRLKINEPKQHVLSTRVTKEKQSATDASHPAEHERTCGTNDRFRSSHQVHFSRVSRSAFCGNAAWTRAGECLNLSALWEQWRVGQTWRSLDDATFLVHSANVFGSEVILLQNSGANRS